MNRNSLLLALAILGLLPVASGLRAQGQPRSPRYAISQTRVVPVHAGPVRNSWSGPSVEVRGVRARIVIREHVATTELTFDLANPSSRRLEAELLVPVPPGAILKGFTFQGSAAEVQMQILPRDEARRIYDGIVRRAQDPALLEFVGLNLLQSSVFPVEPRGSQKVQVTYEQLLERNDNRVDYFLPRSQSIEYRVPWKIDLLVESSEKISTSYSPSHDIETHRLGPGKKQVSVRGKDVLQAGSFRFSYLLERGELTASLLAYPDPSVGGGYFLLMAGLPVEIDREAAGGLKREVTLVLDRSGSMSGEKLDQVKAAALQVIEGLDEGESFNLLVYNESVDVFSSTSVVKSRETTVRARRYLETVRARGGTNIHDALVEALGRKPREGTLPIVLFLTDGLPTMGQTNEGAIRELASRHNPHGRRIFTFGVGADVNTPLLEALAFSSRGVTTYVAPDEDVEVQVADVFRRLSGPILARPELEIIDDAGKLALHRVRDLLPGELPDLFRGDQLIVLGKYLDQESLTFRVRGNFLGQERSYQFRFELDRASTRNAFVPRLWASRKIGMLEDAIRHSVSGLPTFANSPGSTRPHLDPRFQEIVDEIVRLSTRFGILSEYTAFFAEEGTNLASRELLLEQVGDNFYRRSLNCRTGLGSWNQDINRQRSKAQKVLNLDNEFLDATLKKVEITGVQQVSDRAFFKRGKRWIDSRLVHREAAEEPDRVVTLGSAAHRELTTRLAGLGLQACLALGGEIALLVGEERVLIRPEADASETSGSTATDGPDGC